MKYTLNNICNNELVVFVAIVIFGYLICSNVLLGVQLNKEMNENSVLRKNIFYYESSIDIVNIIERRQSFEKEMEQNRLKPDYPDCLK